MAHCMFSSHDLLSVSVLSSASLLVTVHSQFNSLHPFLLSRPQISYILPRTHHANFFRWFGEEFQVIKHIKWFFPENFLLLFFKFICYGKLPHHYSLDSLGKIKITLIVFMLQTIKQTYLTFIVQQYHGYFHGSHIGYCNRLSPSPIT